MIKSPEQVAQQEIKIRILIAGFPGIGKSTLGLSAPNPLHIDVDRGVSRVQAQHRKDYTQPDSYEELLKDLTPGNLTAYNTLVFDTGGKLLDLTKPWAIAQLPQNGQKDGTLSLKGYGAVGREFNRLMDYAYYDLKKHVVVLFHAKEEHDGDTTKLRILVEGQTKDNVWQPMELGGFMEMFGTRRTLGFSNCERYFAKGTHGIKGIRDVPEAGQQNDFLTRLFEEVNQNICRESELFEYDKTAYESVMEAVRPKIDAMTEDDIGGVQNVIKNVTHALTSEKELKALFSARLKELGMRWDKEAKAYVKVSVDSQPA